MKQFISFVFSYELGSGIARLVSDVAVVDGQPHRIEVSRANRFASLSVDDEPKIQGESGGSLEVLNAKGDIYVGRNRKTVSPTVNKQIDKD